jgi:hypothetical protein
MIASITTILALAVRLDVNAAAFVESDDVDTDNQEALEAYFKDDRKAFQALSKEVALVRKNCPHDRLYHQNKSHTECTHCGVRMVTSKGDWIAKEEE